MIALGIIELVIIAAVLFFIFKKNSGAAATEGFHSEPLSKPAASTRPAETLILALAGGTVLFFQITSPDSAGNFARIGQLERIGSTFATVAFFASAAIAVAVFAIAVVVAARGKTIAGAVITLVTLMAFGLSLNFTAGTSFRTSNRMMHDDAVFTLNLTDGHDANLVGAEVFLGEEFLGKTPLTMRVKEFWDKHGGADFEPNDAQQATTTINDDDGNPTSASLLIKISLPRQDGSEFRNFQFVRCPVRAEMDGKPLYGRGGASSSGGGEFFSASSSVHAPHRARQLRGLITRLRLKSYELDDEWVQAFDSFGESGTRRLRKLALEEPALRKVIDQLNSRKLEAYFGITAQLDNKTARRKFDELLRHVDAQKIYSTDSLEGIAVARLAPYLDHGWLVDQIKPIVRHRGNRSFTWGTTIEGEASFGTGSSPRDDPAFDFPVRGFALAHAVWIVDRQLDAQSGGVDHDFQNQVVAEILKWNLGSQDAFRCCRALGGSLFEKYTARLDWRKRYDESDPDWPQNTMFMGSMRVSRAFHQVVHLDNATGAMARFEAKERIFSLIEAAMEHGSEHEIIDALFLDNHLGEKSLAAEFWPRYKARFAGQGDWEVARKWFEYLVNMEPYPSPDMYAMTVREIYELKAKYGNDAIEQWMGSVLTPLSSLPNEKRALVLKAMKAEYLELAVRADDGKPGYNHLEDQLERNYPRAIDTELAKIADPETIAALMSAPYEDQVAGITGNLCKSPHPVISRMLEHVSQRARIDALQAIRRFPAPEYRQLLANLKQHESEPAVLAEIASVEAEWDEVLERPLGELTAGG